MLGFENKVIITGYRSNHLINLKKHIKLKIGNGNLQISLAV